MFDVGELQQLCNQTNWQMLDRPGVTVIYHQMGIYRQRHLAYQKTLILGFARSGCLGVVITFPTA